MAQSSSILSDNWCQKWIQRHKVIQKRHIPMYLLDHLWKSCIFTMTAGGHFWPSYRDWRSYKMILNVNDAYNDIIDTRNELCVPNLLRNEKSHVAIGPLMKKLYLWQLLVICYLDLVFEDYIRKFIRSPMLRMILLMPEMDSVTRCVDHLWISCIFPISAGIHFCPSYGGWRS